METATALEKPAIEDALFGEEQVTVIENATNPIMDSCFCICACRDSVSRSGSSEIDGAALAVGK